jgi:hypothetical protein
MKQNTTFRISAQIKEQLYNAVPKGKRNQFVEEAIAEKLLKPNSSKEHDQRSPVDGC